MNESMDIIPTPVPSLRRRKSWLNLDQSPLELARLYDKEDYYWYLRSQPFMKAFVLPLAGFVNQYADSCLDVGCGEGQLGQALEDVSDCEFADYHGFDGSVKSIDRGKRVYNWMKLTVGRIEDPPDYGRSFDCVVFGNLLKVLVKPECQVELVDYYKNRYSPRYLFVYDLEVTDLSNLDKKYRTLFSYHSEVVMDGIDEVKKKRKIVGYKL